MKKLTRILWPLAIILVVAVILYGFFFHFRTDWTAQFLTGIADSKLKAGRYEAAIRYYSWANDLHPGDETVALHLAEAYEETGNYTKTENVLVHAIYEAPDQTELYVALSKAYVHQDKLLDAQRLLDNIANASVLEELSVRRPEAPVISPEGDRYNDYITVSLTVQADTKCYYTTNGQFPSLKTGEYTEPFSLEGGETTVCAIAVDEEGLVSPAIFVGYTVAGVIEDVEFRDEVLHQYVSDLLHVGNRNIRTDDLWTISELRLPEGITSTEDLRLFSGLAKLTIWDMGDLDYSFLSELYSLRYLELNHCSIGTSDLEEIAKCPNLEVLILANCGLSNIKPLEQLTGLRVLDLSDNSISSISPIVKNPALDELYVGHNALSGLPIMDQLTNLRILDLSYNALDSVSSLKPCTALERINISHNRLVSVKAIGALTNLVYFNGSNNQVRNVDAMKRCTSLETFIMTDNKLVSIDFFDQISTIREINIDYNDVEAVPQLPKDCQLETFSAAHNFLEDLSGLAGLPHLNYVNADYNNISDISVLASCPTLAQVNVYGTYIRSGGALAKSGVVVNFTPYYE